jgi:hypothetical protein
MKGDGTMAREQQHKITGILMILGGLWLIASPYVLGYSSAMRATATDVALGVLIALLYAYRTLSKNERAWLNGTDAGWWIFILALLVIGAPFGLGHATNARFWNDLIVGVVLAILAGWNAETSPEVEVRASS